MPKEIIRRFTFVVCDSGDPSVGIQAMEQTVNIQFPNGLPVTDEDDFNEAAVEFLADYFEAEHCFTGDQWDAHIKAQKDIDTEALQFDADEEGGY